MWNVDKFVVSCTSVGFGLFVYTEQCFGALKIQTFNIFPKCIWTRTTLVKYSVFYFRNACFNNTTNTDYISPAPRFKSLFLYNLGNAWRLCRSTVPLKTLWTGFSVFWNTLHLFNQPLSCLPLVFVLQSALGGEPALSSPGAVSPTKAHFYHQHYGSNPRRRALHLDHMGKAWGTLISF